MKIFILLSIFISYAVLAGLPPTQLKGGNEAQLSTTFNFDLGNIPVTRTGTNVTFGTIPMSQGGTGQTSYTTGSVIFASGTTLSGNSTGLFWNNSSTRLGIGTATPAYTLDVNGVLQNLQSIVNNSSSAVYSASSTSLSTPTGVQTRVTNNSNTNGSLSQLYLTVNNSSALSQRGYIGFISNSGAANYTPSFVLGAQTGVTSYNERMRIDQNGFVGIGTPTPLAKIHVNSELSGSAVLRVSGAPSQTGDYLQINDSASNTLARLASNGSLTIGQSTDASARLTLVGGTGGSPLITLSRPGTGALYSWALAGGGLSFSDDLNGFIVANTFGDGGQNQFYIGQKNKTTSDTRISVLSPTTFGSTAGSNIPANEFYIQGGAGTGNAAVPGIQFRTADVGASGSTAQSVTTKMTLTGSGDLGIGTTTPSNVLHVLKSRSGSGVNAIIENTSATANSDAHVRVRTANGGGNPHFIASRDALAHWSFGLNAGSSDAFQISASQTLGTSNTLTISQSGVVNIPQLTPSLPVKTDASDNLISGAIDLSSGEVSGTLPIARGGTNNGSLSVVSGSVVYTDGSKLMGTGAGTTGQYLKSNGSAAPTWASGTTVTPTVTVYTSGSGTYTTPAGAVYLKIRMVGGGGGGGAGTSGGAASTAGGNTTFGTSLLVANGGSGGVYNGAGGAGGTASLGTGPVGRSFTGAAGQAATTIANASGGQGGSTPFGGAGAGAFSNTVGGAAQANTGSGGGGAGNGAASVSGSGGGAGGYVDAIISSPAASYSYAVGAGGTGQTGSPSGGAGAAGIIIIESY